MVDSRRTFFENRNMDQLSHSTSAPTTKKFNRLPRFRRVSQPPRMVLTERDKEVLRLIHAFRLLTREQVERLVFARLANHSEPTRADKARTRLRLLYHHRYVERIAAPVRPGVWGWRPIYRLGQKG